MCFFAAYECFECFVFFMSAYHWSGVCVFECLFKLFLVCMFKELLGSCSVHDWVGGECWHRREVIAGCDIVTGYMVIQVCLCVSENHVWCTGAIVTHECGGV